MRVLVTGATGQLGSYACQELAVRGHAVVGVGSPGSTRALPPGVVKARGAWTRERWRELVMENGVDAIIHAGAPTDIPRSWDTPTETYRDIAELTAAAAMMLAAEAKGVRFVHTASSNAFGRVGARALDESHASAASRALDQSHASAASRALDQSHASAASRALDESTPLAPVSPYGIAKACAQIAVAGARAMGAAASNLIVFMALSPRSSPALVLRKITRGLAAVARGDAKTLKLGTMQVVRDVSHARDIARAAVMLALGEIAPGDYCAASGVGRSIREMAEVACDVAGMRFDEVIEEDTGYARPNDIASLVGDVTKLRGAGWSPEVSFEALVRECWEHDRRAAGAAC